MVLLAAVLPVRLRRHLSGDGIAGAVASAAGWASGRVLASGRSLPSLAGAVLVSVCAGGFAGHVFGHGLTPWVAGVVGGVFLLWIGTEINRAS